MKKCPGCDRTYTEEKLRFCVACGGALTADLTAEDSSYDPFKTMVAVPRPEPTLEAEPPSAAAMAETIEDPVNPSWVDIGAKIAAVTPGQEPSQGLAMGAMICGLVGLFCGVLSFLGPVGAILGFVALNKQKADPQLYTGRNFAIIGIVTGLLSTLIMIGGVMVLIFLAINGGPR
ncbi:MAG: DUF4190 domain-containing protein [Pyrinomonadaceae bacterium]